MAWYFSTVLNGYSPSFEFLPALYTPSVEDILLFGVRKKRTMTSNNCTNAMVVYSPVSEEPPLDPLVHYCLVVRSHAILPLEVMEVVDDLSHSSVSDFCQTKQSLHQACTTLSGSISTFPLLHAARQLGNILHQRYNAPENTENRRYPSKKKNSVLEVIRRNIGTSLEFSTWKQFEQGKNTQRRSLGIETLWTSGSSSFDSVLNIMPSCTFREDSNLLTICANSRAGGAFIYT